MADKCSAVCIGVLGLLLCAFTESGEQNKVAERDYWPNGNIKVVRKLDANGKIIAKGLCRADGTIEKLERYDKDGNKVEESYYDEDEDLKEGVDGWAARRRWYQDGVMREERFYAVDGRIMERRQYSQSGMLLRKQFVGDPGVEEESYAPQAGYGRELVEQYTSDGKLLSRRKYVD